MAGRGHRVESLEARENSTVHIGDTYHGREAPEDQRHRVLSWLNPPPAGAPLRSRREPGTNLWFLNTDLFHSWHSGENRFMFLHGIVGCGKTTLLSSIAKQCRERLGPNDFVAAFYFSSTTNEGIDLHAFLRFLVAQLCLQDVIPVPLENLYARHSRSFPPTSPSDEDLEELVAALLSLPWTALYADKPIPTTFSGQVFVLVDGLDEIRDRTVRKHITGYLNELCRLETSRIRMLVTSRPEADFLTTLRADRGWQVLSIPRDKVRDDIEIFVTHELNKHAELEDLEESVQSEVLARLAGPDQAMFRWASLQLSRLLDTRLLLHPDVFDTLSTLPKDLNQTYDQILGEIPSAHHRLASSALRWLTLACRPLFVEEIIEACLVSAAGHSSKPYNDSRLRPFDILRLLSNLVLIEPALDMSKGHQYERKKHSVMLAHFSVMEYLIQGDMCLSLRQAFTIRPEDGHYSIALDCVNHLCRTFRYRTDPTALCNYAWDYWAFHWVSSERMDPTDVEHEAMELTALTVSIRTKILDSPPSGPLDPESITPRLQRLMLNIPWWLDEADAIAALTEPNIGKAPDGAPDEGRTSGGKLDAVSQAEDEEDDEEEDTSPDLWQGDDAISLKMAHVFRRYARRHTESEHARRHTESEYWEQSLSLIHGTRLHSDEMRLLELLPSEHGFVPIQCRLRRTKAQRQYLYEAVSHSPGLRRNLKPAWVNGKLSLITPNLSNLLRNLRRKQDARVLWIDDICVNPFDDREKDMQSKLRSQILADSSRVAIWAGEGADDTAFALRVLHAIDDTIEGRSREFEAIEFASELDQKTHFSPYHALKDLFETAWWHRIWHVRDVALAPRASLLYGERSLDIQTLVRLTQNKHIARTFLERFLPDQQGSDIWFESVAWHRAMGLAMIVETFKRRGAVPLSRLIYWTRYHRTTAIKDRFSSLNDMLGPNKHGLDVFWMSFRECSARVFCAAMCAERNLDVLSLISRRGDEELDLELATWTSLCYWSEKDEVAEPLLSQDMDDRQSADDASNARFCASAGFTEPILERAGTLVLTGWHVDTLSKSWILETSDRCVKRFSEAGYEQYTRLRVHFHTSGEHCCLVPAESQKGDQVYILAGGRTPYVLRRQEEGYAFIGECLVIGFMHGQLFANGDKQEDMEKITLI